VGFERVVGNASAQNLKAILDGLCQRHGLTDAAVGQALSATFSAIHGRAIQRFLS
jgi:hypothetical protein